MALKFNFGIPNTSAVVNDAYAKVIIAWYDPSDKIEIRVFIYASEQDRNDNKNTVDILGASIQLELQGDIFNTYFSPEALSVDGANIIKNSYEFLKTLPEYAGAVDI